MRIAKHALAESNPHKPRIRPPSTEKFAQIRALLSRQKLHTVCAEANCPNLSECWSSGTATFMILGDTCTRACKFCNIKTGNPRGKIDHNEPQKLVESVRIMGLKYVVITCVTRDDLPDGGAQHFADCINALRKAFPNLLIEVLISDLAGNIDALRTIINANPDVLAHNIETVKRLQQKVRDPRTSYERSLEILARAKDLSKKLYTKSSIMLGMGETQEEVEQAMRDLRKINVDILTLGQYLQPSPLHHPVAEYLPKEKFAEYETFAKELGFLYCASGPLVRSSYKAAELINLKH